MPRPLARLLALTLAAVLSCAPGANAQWNGPDGPQLMVIFAAQRTGTHFLESVMLRSPGMYCFGEAFNRVNRYTDPLGEKWRNKFYKQNHVDTFNAAMYDHIVKRHPQVEVYSYVVFERQMTDNKMQQIIANPNIKKMLWTRSNFVEIHASDLKAKQTGAYFGIDSGAVNVTIHKTEFRQHWMHYRNHHFKLLRWMFEAEEYPMMYNYEQLNHPFGAQNTFLVAKQLWNQLGISQEKQPDFKTYVEGDCSGRTVKKLATRPVGETINDLFRWEDKVKNYQVYSTTHICNQVWGTQLKDDPEEALVPGLTV